MWTKEIHLFGNKLTSGAKERSDADVWVSFWNTYADESRGAKVEGGTWVEKDGEVNLGKALLISSGHLVVGG